MITDIITSMFFVLRLSSYSEIGVGEKKRTFEHIFVLEDICKTVMELFAGSIQIEKHGIVDSNLFEIELQ